MAQTFVINSPVMSCCGNARGECECEQRIAAVQAQIVNQERERAEAAEGDDSPLMIPTMTEILNCEQDEMRHENARRLSGKSAKTEEDEMADLINEVTADDDDLVENNEDAPLTVPVLDWKQISAENSRRENGQRGSSSDIHQADDDGEALLPTPPSYDWDAISRENARRR